MVQSPPRRKWYVFYIEGYVRYQQPSEAMQKNCNCMQFLHTNNKLSRITHKHQQHRQEINSCRPFRLLSSFNTMCNVCHVCDARETIMSRENDSLLMPKIIDVFESKDSLHSRDLVILLYYVLKYRQTI